MALVTLTAASTTSKPQAQVRNTSQSSQYTASSSATISPRPRPIQAQSATPIANNVGGTSNPSSALELAHNPQRTAAVRCYSTHLPYNPSRPPPHTYTRRHEFPPFPPLAQHPVLPFLTTAFANTQDSHTAATINSKPRSAQASRLSSTGKHVHSSVSTIPTMDVSKHDPTAVFIRPPLVVPYFRDDETNIDPSCINDFRMYREPAPGTPLTYAILHTHRNWFLDADDFRKENPNRIDYPHELEPPRGWAPLTECIEGGAVRQIKDKKDKNNSVRTKGSYTHPELAGNDTTIQFGPSDESHEKTVLRCTFCRREYHGPNAKSMWRRHVYDKHKVAMKNRREGSAGMAPQLQKKRGKDTESSPELGLPSELTNTLATLDLTNEETLIRLLERLISGDLDINIPSSLLNPPNGTVEDPTIQAVIQALQNGVVSVPVEGNKSQLSSVPDSRSGVHPHPGILVKKAISKSRKRDEQRREKERRDEEIIRAASGPSIGVESNAPPSNATGGTGNVVGARRPKYAPFELSQSHVYLAGDVMSQGQKRKVDEVERDIVSSLERVPLKDNTILDRSNHNQSSRTIPSTPTDKKKENALATSPGSQKFSQWSLNSSPSSLHPYTPTKPPSALRSRALATTGEESYLTRIVSSPATASPGRESSKVPFTSPFRSRTSPSKCNPMNNYLSTSDDTYGNFTQSSPRYSFELDIQASSSISASVPLELGHLGPAHWSPPPLDPPALVSEPASRSISRSGSTLDDNKRKTPDDDDFQAGRSELSSPSERVQRQSRNTVEDFNMDAYLDLKDAAPASETNPPLSPSKNASARGLQFSKEYGLLSPSEVERITASARPTCMEDARNSKRRKVDDAET